MTSRNENEDDASLIICGKYRMLTSCCPPGTEEEPKAQQQQEGGSRGNKNNNNYQQQGNYANVCFAERIEDGTPVGQTVAVKWCYKCDSKKYLAILKEKNCFQKLQSQLPSDELPNDVRCDEDSVSQPFSASGSSSPVASPLVRQGIVGFLDYLEDEHRAFIILEQCECDLMTFVRLNGPLCEWQAKCAMQQLLTSLSFLHDSGFAHRDVKPHNLLVASFASSLSLDTNAVDGTNPQQVTSNTAQQQQTDAGAAEVRPPQTASDDDALPSADPNAATMRMSSSSQHLNSSLVSPLVPLTPMIGPSANQTVNVRQIVNYNVRLADFGLVKPIDRFPRTNSSGDYDFLSPEVMDAVHNAELLRPQEFFMNDSYAAGLTMFILLTGTLDKNIINMVQSSPVCSQPLAPCVSSSPPGLAGGGHHNVVDDEDSCASSVNQPTPQHALQLQQQPPCPVAQQCIDLSRRYFGGRYSPHCIHLLCALLARSPHDRLLPSEALIHDWFAVPTAPGEVLMQQMQTAMRNLSIAPPPPAAHQQPEEDDDASAAADTETVTPSEAMSSRQVSFSPPPPSPSAHVAPQHQHQTNVGMRSMSRSSSSVGIGAAPSQPFHADYHSQPAAANHNITQSPTRSSNSGFPSRQSSAMLSSPALLLHQQHQQGSNNSSSMLVPSGGGSAVMVFPRAHSSTLFETGGGGSSGAQTKNNSFTSPGILSPAPVLGPEVAEASFDAAMKQDQ